MNDLTEADPNHALALRQSVLGTELDEAESRALAARMDIVRLAPGEYLVREGEARRTLFLLTDGRLCVCKTLSGRDELVYQMRPGECAGTRAFIDGAPRQAGLRADAACVVMTLEPDDFEALLGEHPRIVYKVMRAIFRSTHTNLMRVNFDSAEMRNYVTKSGGRY